MRCWQVVNTGAGALRMEMAGKLRELPLWGGRARDGLTGCSRNTYHCHKLKEEIREVEKQMNGHF